MTGILQRMISKKMCSVYFYFSLTRSGVLCTILEQNCNNTFALSW